MRADAGVPSTREHEGEDKSSAGIEKCVPTLEHRYEGKKSYVPTLEHRHEGK